MKQAIIIIKTIIGSLLLLLFASCSASRQTAVSDVAGNLIIYYDPATGKGELLEAAKKYGSKVLYEYKNFNIIAVSVPQKRTTAKAIRFYKKVKGVLSVTEDRIQDTGYRNCIKPQSMGRIIFF